jgi:hypothetical protein
MGEGRWFSKNGTYRGRSSAGDLAGGKLAEKRNANFKEMNRRGWPPAVPAAPAGRAEPIERQSRSGFGRGAAAGHRLSPLPALGSLHQPMYRVPRHVVGDYLGRSHELLRHGAQSGHPDGEASLDGGPLVGPAIAHQHHRTAKDIEGDRG